MCVKIGLCSEVNTDIQYVQAHDGKENVWTCESNRKVEKCLMRRFKTVFFIIIRVVVSSRTRQTEHVATWGKIRTVYSILVTNPK